MWVSRAKYATPNVTKYQRSNFILQILQFTVKITAISIILPVEYIMFLEFNLISTCLFPCHSCLYQVLCFLIQNPCFINQGDDSFDQFSLISRRTENVESATHMLLSRNRPKRREEFIESEHGGGQEGVTSS